ncbi:60S ribosomal protein L27B [Teratosphaeriaceae sp. CCFEE 6253]|nr:60S ribosomal protein L27B [Teratosphaeriaceae sp. CCFEE 6253]
MKFLKVGRVAIITRGRYAGKKVVIIQPQDNGSKKHPFPHALVAGIERYPSQVTRRMSKARASKRSKVKPFIKVVNYNHIMPTRYTLELEGLKGVVTNDTFGEVSQREEAKKTVKKALEERYQSGKNRWFFTALRGQVIRKRINLQRDANQRTALFQSLAAKAQEPAQQHNGYTRVNDDACCATTYGRLSCSPRESGFRDENANEGALNSMPIAVDHIHWLRAGFQAWMVDGVDRVSQQSCSIPPPGWPGFLADPVDLDVDFPETRS